MAEETEKTESGTTPPTQRQLTAAREFAAAHGKPSKAVVEHVGRAGARVVLVGADGAMGDVFVPSVATGAALVEAIEDIEAAEWDSETVNATDIGAAHRRRMAGSKARR
ncbi:hypothetical protein CFN78_15285 [Amycolatopsis antarctica]|uniref:Uncharacterized protein n=1 Tax=Amycolatopsis antarctica TaxID=1854586 RepID=A0A263D2Q7_9PSEU|nr:hypothetical protein [Amycolatopsis antarctica]OZM72358.1 hypothetical protein CFN78_15285 [Amycolatopsis antarctica]